MRKRIKLHVIKCSICKGKGKDIIVQKFTSICNLCTDRFQHLKCLMCGTIYNSDKAFRNIPTEFLLKQKEKDHSDRPNTANYLCTQCLSAVFRYERKLKVTKIFDNELPRVRGK